MFKNFMATCAFLTLGATSVLAVEAKAPAVAAKAIVEGVEVRQAPDDKSPSIAKLKKGENVTASDRKGAYWKIKMADGREGFVSVASLQTKAGINEVKSAYKSATAPAQPGAPSMLDSAKGALNSKVAEEKAKQDAAPKKEDKSGASLEKAANDLFKRK